MDVVTVNVKRDGRFWFVELPQFDGATQARSLREVPDMAQDWLESTTGRADYKLDIQVELPVEARQHVEAAARLQEQAAQARSSAAKESREAARVLRRQGLTLRDIGSSLGISHQRAQQLIGAPNAG